MNRKYIIARFFLIAIICSFPDCERGEFNWGISVGNLIYSGNVIFLGNQELALITGIADDGIVFSDKIGEVENIKVGSILVMGVSEMTPYGSLRKATFIKMNGNEVIVNTTDALITDAIKEGTIRIEKRLLEKDFTLKDKVDGVLVTGPEKAFDGLAITLDHLELNGNGAVTASMEGAIGISADIEVVIEVRFNEIHEISISTTLNKIDEIIVTSDGAFNGSNEITAAEFTHVPIVIDSLVVVPEVIIKCGYEGSVQGESISGVRQDRLITSGMRYQRSDWTADPLSNSENHDFIEPQITGNSDLKVFSGPEILVRLFGVPVQSIQAAGFYSLESGNTIPPDWSLSIGCEGYNTCNADILGLRGDYSQNMTIEADEISSAKGR